MSVKVDYKSGATWRIRRQVRFYGLLVITLIFIGFFGSILAYISKNPASDLKLSLAPLQGVQEALKPPPASNRPAAEDRTKPKYEFYKMLPERRVLIRQDELNPPAPARPQTAPQPEPTGKPPVRTEAGTKSPVQSAGNPPPADTPPKTTSPTEPADPVPATEPKPSSGGYVLQAGAFRNRAEADRLEASIALLGVNAHIVSSAGADGVTLHRVLIGPIQGADKVENLRLRLQASNIPVIAVKTR